MSIPYPYMPEGRTIHYVDEHNKYMQQAKEFASKSKDQSTPTGAVAVFGIAVVGGASNKPPITNKKLVLFHKENCIRRFFHIKTGKHYWMCPGCAGPKNHAESRVSAQATKEGIRDFDLYLWGHWWCCEDCWNAMIDAGVKDVYLLEGSEVLFNPNEVGNIIGRQFKQ